MKTPKKPERRFGSWWQCPNCEGNPEFNHADMMAHMKDAHGIDTKGAKGTRSMLMHMDGDTWFASKYEWEISGLKFTQETCTKRTGENAMMWAQQD